MCQKAREASRFDPSGIPRAEKSQHQESRSAKSRRDLNRPLGRTRGKRSEEVVNQSIGVSGVKKLLHIEIMIRDFPTRYEPFNLRTRVRGSKGVRVRHFGVSEDKRYCCIMNHDFTIPDRRRGSGDVEE
jgi:hypothetical protein